MNACTISACLQITAGTSRDYRAFESFHYRGGIPVGITRVFVATCNAPHPHLRALPPAGIVVETVSPLVCVLRNVALPGRFLNARGKEDRRLAAACLNRDMRTIARVVIHPLFRGTGLAVRLVKHVLATAQTPYIEALAAMGRVHPLFEQAGMRLFDRPPLADAVRLAAALEREGLRPLDLMQLPAENVPPFLAAELRRFARRKEGGVTAWLAEARRRLLSQPVYYLWSRAESAA